jgi:V8-like Glu-specific endopeptidase
MKPNPYLTTFFLFLSFSIAGIASGQIYKYQDAQGNWHFTDSPERIPKDAQKMRNSIPNTTQNPDLKKQLYDKFSPRNRVEEATLGTVTIKTPAGSGSGFFVTEEGHILTNKHVIRPDAGMKERAASHYESLDKKAEQISKNFAAEDSRLRSLQESLEKLKKLAEGERNPTMKAFLEDKHKTDREALERLEQDLEGRKNEFQEKKEIYEKEKRDFQQKASRADRTMNFTITLKDNSEQDAYLVAISETTDLALLKIDARKTPVLKLGRLDQVTQGETVYAIGSPVGLKDSVSSGIISGFDGFFLKTDAKIYPGNSGGPLINQRGEVIGINTLKEITHKFEGLGFAISTDAALREFGELARTLRK